MARPEPATRPRAHLSRERVLEAAVAFADRHGLEALSMRKLGERLGTSAMALYHYVPNKERLLDGMIEIVFAEIEPPSAQGDWKAELRKRALSTRDALRRHPWAVGEMEGRTEHGPANLGLHNDVLGCLRSAGFSIENTVRAYSVLDAYMYGFALQERDMSSETAEDFAAEAQRQMVDYQALLADYPYLVEVVGGHVAEAGYDYESEFRFGLDLILDGLETLRDA